MVNLDKLMKKKRKRVEEIKRSNEPKGILELEALADKAYCLSSRVAEPDISVEVMVALLRQQYNLNFVLLCEKCHGAHRYTYDELEAPDR